jgi:hypothetical protein
MPPILHGNLPERLGRQTAVPIILATQLATQMEHTGSAGGLAFGEALGDKNTVAVVDDPRYPGPLVRCHWSLLPSPRIRCQENRRVMLKIKIPTPAALTLLVLLAGAASAQESQPPPTTRVPSMSNDDMGAPAKRPSGMKPSAPAGASTGAWKEVPAAFARVTSFRARVLNALPNAQTEILLEVVQPDRFHSSIGGQIEMIAVGSNSYVKVSGSAWMKAPGADAGGVSLQDISSKVFHGVQSAKPAGTETIDGVETNIFDVVSAAPNGAKVKQRVWAGKSDGLPRKIEESRGTAPPVTIFFYDYDESISIEEPSL